MKIHNEKRIKIARKIIQIIGTIIGLYCASFLFVFICAFGNGLTEMKLKEIGLVLIFLIPISLLFLYLIYTAIILWYDFSRKALKRFTLITSIFSFMIFARISNYIETIYKIKLENELSTISVIITFAPFFIAYGIYKIMLKMLIKFTQLDLNLTYKKTKDKKEKNIFK